MAQFPSIRATKMLSVLCRDPLGYGVVRQKGSHRLLKSDHGYPDLRFSFHDKVTLAPGVVRAILVREVGLTEEEALGLL